MYLNLDITLMFLIILQTITIIIGLIHIKNTHKLTDVLCQLLVHLTDEEKAVRSSKISKKIKTAWENGCYATETCKAAKLENVNKLHNPETYKKISTGLKLYWQELSPEERAIKIEQRKQNLARGCG